MALPADGQNANDLTKVTEIPAGKELIFFDPTTNEGGIITLGESDEADSEWTDLTNLCIRCRTADDTGSA